MSELSGECKTKNRERQWKRQTKEIFIYIVFPRHWKWKLPKMKDSIKEQINRIASLLYNHTWSANNAKTTQALIHLSYSKQVGSESIITRNGLVHDYSDFSRGWFDIVGKVWFPIMPKNINLQTTFYQEWIIFTLDFTLPLALHPLYPWNT